MYIIIKSPGSYSIIDSEDGSNRDLDAALIESVKKLFPKLVGNSTMLFEGLRVEAIPPKKLGELTLTSITVESKKLVAPTGSK